MTNTDGRTDVWLRRFGRPSTGDHRLICFPHAGGSASYFMPLAAQLSPSIEMLSVQYPGRQDRHREPMIDDVHRLAADIAPVLADATNRPLVLFGHSLGAIVAYEVARILKDTAPGRPAALAVSGRAAPDIRRHTGPTDLSDASLTAELAALSGTDPRVLVDADVRALVLPVLRNDLRAVQAYRYRPGPPLRCPLTVLTGDADPWVTPDEARAWRGHTAGPFESHTFPGGHFYLNECREGVTRALVGLVTSVSADNGSLRSDTRDPPHDRMKEGQHGQIPTTGRTA